MLINIVLVNYSYVRASVTSPFSLENPPFFHGKVRKFLKNPEIDGKVRKTKNFCTIMQKIII